MNFQPLRWVWEAARCSLNLTEVANTLHTPSRSVDLFFHAALHQHFKLSKYGLMRNKIS